MGYQQIGKIAVNAIRKHTKPNIYNNLETSEISIMQEVKQLIKQLPESTKREVQQTTFKVMLGASMKTKSVIIGMDKKERLLSALMKKYNRDELKEIMQANTPEKLSEATTKFMGKIETSMPQIYSSWLGIPKITPEIASKGFETVRKQILTELYGKCSKKDYQKLASINDESSFEKCSSEIIKKIQSKKFQEGIPIEIEQAVYDFRTKRNDTLLDIYKAIKIPPQNPKVINIERVLNEQYGMRFVDLADNEKLAVNVLKAVRLARSQNRTIPNNLIVTNMLSGSGEALQHYNLETTVLLEQTKSSDIAKWILSLEREKASPLVNKIYNKFIDFFTIKEQSYLSTTHPLHTVIHEFNHLGQSSLLASRFRKIPSEYKHTYQKLSGYASEGIPGEIEAELLTKQQLGRLTSEEKRLLEFFG